MSSNKQKELRERLEELCVAHTQIFKAREKHEENKNTSQIFLEMYEQKIRELEGKAMGSLKHFLGLEGPQSDVGNISNK